MYDEMIISDFTYEKIKKFLSEIERRIDGHSEKLTGLEYSECGYKTSVLPSRGMRWTPVAG